MKKNRKDNREFKQLKEQLIGIRQVVKHTKIGNLWTHEASLNTVFIRIFKGKKLRAEFIRRVCKSRCLIRLFLFKNDLD